MINEHIKFSVLVPVHNVEKYIDECIQSVLNQTYSNYELIIVDDGSIDQSGIICDEYAKIYPQISVYHKPNQGLIHTRRYALNHAVGDYFVHLDSDDMIEPYTLETLYKTICRNHCDCVFFNRKTLKNGAIKKPTEHIIEGFYSDDRQILRKVLIENPYNALVLKCAKASLYSDMDYSPFYRLCHGEDLLQTLEILEQCHSAEFIDDALYIYRLRDGSITHRTKDWRENTDFTIREEALRFVYRKDLFTDEDMIAYRDKCISIFVDQIINICNMNISYSDKKEAFKIIRKKEYYNSFLTKWGITTTKRLGKKAVSYFLFIMNLDSANLFLLKGFSRIRQTTSAKCL